VYCRGLASPDVVSVRAREASTAHEGMSCTGYVTALFSAAAKDRASRQYARDNPAARIRAIVTSQ
jgi:hypothetical protein